MALWYLLFGFLLISKLYYIAAELVIGYLSSGCYHMGCEAGIWGCGKAILQPLAKIFASFDNAIESQQ